MEKLQLLIKIYDYINAKMLCGGVVEQDKFDQMREIATELNKFKTFDFDLSSDVNLMKSVKKMMRAI